MVLRGALALGLLCWHVAWGHEGPRLRVTDLTNGTGGEVLLCRSFPPDGVTLSFTHSMYGGEVRERFLAAGDALRRVEMTTANAAAAEYYAYTVDVIAVGDRYRVDAPPAEYDEIVVLVDDVGRHRLTVGDETVDLLALAGNAHRLRLDVVQSGLFGRWWSGGC